EELYWHPRFLLGDLKRQSIMEIWNSQKAKDLFFLRQDGIQESSPCKHCKDFTDCRKFKHVCWRDTILAYGTDKWDYPDPSCPSAPYIEKDISL
ncbi:MAG: SPASM domain-containing protein, partial [Parabacteroides sp.]